MVLYVHCHGGHGRTGTISALLLGRLYGLPAVRCAHPGLDLAIQASGPPPVSSWCRVWSRRVTVLTNPLCTGTPQLTDLGGGWCGALVPIMPHAHTQAEALEMYQRMHDCRQQAIFGAAPGMLTEAVSHAGGRQLLDSDSVGALFPPQIAQVVRLLDGAPPSQQSVHDLKERCREAQVRACVLPTNPTPYMPDTHQAPHTTLHTSHRLHCGRIID
jgi:hypothetical protein